MSATSMSATSTSATTLTAEERQAFLAGIHIGVLSVDRPGRAPLTVPIWYDYEPGGELVIWTGARSVKAELIKQAGRFSFCVQNETDPVRYVTAEGPVVGWEDPTPPEVMRRVAARYVAAEELDRYVERMGQDPTVAISMRPTSWLSMDEERSYAAMGLA